MNFPPRVLHFSALVAAYLYQVVNHKYSLVGYYSEDIQHLLLVQDTNFVENSFESVELVVHPALASLFVLVIVVALVLVVGAHVMTLANSKLQFEHPVTVWDS